MLPASAILAAVLLVGEVAHADTSLAVGYAISQYDKADIKDSPDEVCQPDEICLFGWSRWTLNIQRTISGPSVKGRIYAVHMQHVSYNRAYFSRLRLFVLEYIKEPAERERLHADYKLLALPAEQRMICGDTNPQRAGISADDVYAGVTGDANYFCFIDPRYKH
jgi:hypothetical protein